MDLITFAVAALATARITKLVTSDRITQAPRNALLRRLDSTSLLAYLVVCDWCVSVYVGAAVVAVVLWGGSVGWWVLAALAFSYTAGWLASKEGE